MVEDEKLVRDLVREILSQHGYNVLEASRGTEALEVSGRHKGPIHLLISDVVMPGMTGPELARRLTALRREMGVLFVITSYSIHYTKLYDVSCRHGDVDCRRGPLGHPPGGESYNFV